jgi:hypothetical protein
MTTLNFDDEMTFETAEEFYARQPSPKQILSPSAYYTIQIVDGDGEWKTIATKPTEKSSFKRSRQAFSDFLESYGQQLRHIESGRLVGSVRVIGKDGFKIDDYGQSYA